MVVDRAVATNATRSVFKVALITAESLNKASYHFNENPIHLPPYLDSLKDWLMSITIGRYIKIITNIVTNSDVYLVFILWNPPNCAVY